MEKKSKILIIGLEGVGKSSLINAIGLVLGNRQSDIVKEMRTKKQQQQHFLFPAKTFSFMDMEKEIEITEALFPSNDNLSLLDKLEEYKENNNLVIFLFDSMGGELHDEFYTQISNKIEGRFFHFFHNFYIFFKEKKINKVVSFSHIDKKIKDDMDQGKIKTFQDLEENISSYRQEFKKTIAPYLNIEEVFFTKNKEESLDIFFREEI